MSTREYAYYRVLISSMHTLEQQYAYNQSTSVVSIQCMNIMDINTTTYQSIDTNSQYPYQLVLAIRRLRLPVPLAKMHPPGYPGGMIVIWQRRRDRVVDYELVLNSTIMHTTRSYYLCQENAYYSRVSMHSMIAEVCILYAYQLQSMYLFFIYS